MSGSQRSSRVDRPCTGPHYKLELEFVVLGMKGLMVADKLAVVAGMKGLMVAGKLAAVAQAVVEDRLAAGSKLAAVEGRPAAGSKLAAVAHIAVVAAQVAVVAAQIVVVVA